MDKDIQRKIKELEKAGFQRGRTSASNPDDSPEISRSDDERPAGCASQAGRGSSPG